MKDTKFERAQHEATGKHQGNLKRFLRGVHQEQEKEEREKQRAKAEVDRLRGLVGGSPSPSVKATTSTTSKSRASAAAPQASVAERKKQMAQLAEMGITVPDEYRGDLALAGNWQTMAQRPIDQGEGLSSESLSIGVRKRKMEDDDEEETTNLQSTTRKTWGSTTKTYPGTASRSDAALDDLLNRGTLPKRQPLPEAKSEPVDQTNGDKKTSAPAAVVNDDTTEDDKSAVKKEIENLETSTSDTHRFKEEGVGAEPIFKRRKPKFAKHG